MPRTASAATLPAVTCGAGAPATARAIRGRAERFTATRPAGRADWLLAIYLPVPVGLRDALLYITPATARTGRSRAVLSQASGRSNPPAAARWWALLCGQ